MSRLTDRTFTTGVSTTDLIHIVVTGDTSQSSDGSSYKATIQQLIDLIIQTTGTKDYYGSFYDTGDQTGLASTVLTMSASTSDTWNSGVTLSADTKFVIENPGVYNLAFSAQMVKTGGNSNSHVHIWLSQNGLDVPYSASQVAFPSNSVYIVAAWNFFFETTSSNEYVELKWDINSNVNNQILIKYEPATSDIPETPSLIVTINKVN